MEVMYLFFLQLFKDLSELRLAIEVIGYDNACQLLAFAKSKRELHKPWSLEFLDKVRMILDGFHKGNHTWCLKNLPEVNPDTEANSKLMAGKKSESCEQLNSWINWHTASGREMTPGHFGVYWWAIFREHNAWIVEQAESKRRRYARGHMKHDPDLARSNTVRSA